MASRKIMEVDRAYSGSALGMRPQAREIPRDRVLGKMRAENPWWREPGASAVPYRELKPRAYRNALLRLVTMSHVRRAVILMGPRRVGKTVLLHHIIHKLIRRGIEPRRICYVSVDQPIYLSLDVEEFLGAFIEAAGLAGAPSKRVYLFLDEIQYLHGWDVHLKTFVDSHPEVRVVASGSAAAALRLKSAESGAGRFTDFLLPPLTFSEY